MYLHIFQQKTILRKDDLRKSEQALMKPLKGKITAETGSIYRKSDIAKAKINLHLAGPGSGSRKKPISRATQEAAEDQFSRKIGGKQL